MNPKDFAVGIGAFAGGLAALFGAAVVAERYVARREEQGEDGTGALGAVDASGQPAATLPPASATEEGGFAPSDQSAEHVPTDLMGETRPGSERAPAAFRPDIDAPMTAAEREALRPATGPGPSLVSGVPNIADEVVRPPN